LNTPHVLVLAAGASSRFGSPKALARIDGHTLLDSTLAKARAIAGDNVTVVLGANAESIIAASGLSDSPINRSQADIRPRVTINPHWADGLASSLKHGIALVPDDAAAALVVLVDQPGVSSADLSMLIDAWRNRPLTAAAAEYAGDVGAPCILPRAIFDAIMTLQGDRGAKAVLQSLGDVTRVRMPLAQFDIDTPAELERFTQDLPSAHVCEASGQT